MKKIMTLSFLIGAIFTINGQELTTISNNDLQMVTNRPGATESSLAVYKGGFQIEAGLEYGKVPFDKNRESYTNYLYLPNVGIQYGISKNIELRVFTTHLLSKYTMNEQSTSFESSLNEINVGAKINLVKSKGWVPEMALLVNQGIPTTRNDSTKQWPTKAVLAWSHSLPANWGVSGNLGYTNQKQSIHNNINYSHALSYTLNLGYAIKDNLGVFAEAFGEEVIDSNNGFPLNIDGGAWYRFSNKFQIDGSLGYGLNQESYYLNIGMSWLVLK